MQVSVPLIANNQGGSDMKLLLISSVIIVTGSVMASETYPASDGPLEGMRFVSIPAGEFLIGSDIPDGDHFDEIPQMLVQIIPSR